jgi:mannose-6-phosphate isomerase|tara:strand:- start:2408 stop:2782 length:375 start_codon:yes stop_codon:yes gene_type:complete
MIEMLNRKREVIKPWGKEVIWAETKDYVGKLLYINEGHKLSLQYHEEKEETILVISGELELTISGHARLGMSTLRLSEGDTFHVTPGTIHRFSATLGTNVVLAEVSTNYLDDVVRLEDDYDRDC